MTDRHEPLPYVVRLRSFASEDAPATVTEHRIVAYSVTEALFQAMHQQTSLPQPPAELRVESIGPDVEAYIDMVLTKLAKVVKP